MSQNVLNKWIRKFDNAFRGLWRGMRGQSSFLVHIPMAIAVISLAAVLSLPLARWCLLLLCIAIVISAEYFNSALEMLAKSITTEHDTNIEHALNIASAAVLILAVFASLVGAIIFTDALLN